MRDSSTNPLVSEIQVLLTQCYLNKHPKSSSEDMLVNCCSGVTVMDHITTIIEGAKDSLQESPNHWEQLCQDVPVDEIAKDQDERYQAIIQSAKNAKHLVEFLFQANGSSFGLIEKNNYQTKIRKLEQGSGQSCKKVILAKTKLLEMMENKSLKPGIPEIQKTLHVLLASIRGLINRHGMILQSESELMNIYMVFSQTLIKNYFGDIKKRAKSDSIKKIVKIYNYIAKQGKQESLDLNNLEVGKVSESINSIQVNLETKRNDILHLKKVVDFIETIAGLIDPDSKSTGSKKAASSTLNQAKAKSRSSGKRMSIAGKLFGRFKKKG